MQAIADRREAGADPSLSALRTLFAGSIHTLAGPGDQPAGIHLTSETYEGVCSVVRP